MTGQDDAVTVTLDWGDDDPGRFGRPTDVMALTSASADCGLPSPSTSSSGDLPTGRAGPTAPCLGGWASPTSCHPSRSFDLSFLFCLIWMASKLPERLGLLVPEQPARELPEVCRLGDWTARFSTASRDDEVRRVQLTDRDVECQLSEALEFLCPAAPAPELFPSLVRRRLQVFGRDLSRRSRA